MSETEQEPGDIEPASTAVRENEREPLKLPAGGGGDGADGIRFRMGHALRDRRESMGMSQQEVADKAGIEVHIVDDLEQGRGDRARLSDLSRTAHALDCRLDFGL